MLTHTFLIYIFRIITELFLLCSSYLLPSTSDFWWDTLWELSFGGDIANFMSNNYQFNNGLWLSISNTTTGYMKIQERITELLRYANPTVDRSKALINFKHWENPKTDENFIYWL